MGGRASGCSKVPGPPLYGTSTGVRTAPGTSRWPSLGLRAWPHLGQSLSYVLEVAPGDPGSAWVRVLPGGRALTFAKANRATGAHDLYLLALDGSEAEPRVLLEGVTFAEYAPTGHFVFGREGALHAVSFDLDRLEARGAPTPIVANLQKDALSRLGGEFAIADNSTLVHLPEQGIHDWRLAWVDAGGEAAFLTVPAANYTTPRVSPSGQRISVVTVGDRESDRRVATGDAAGGNLRDLSETSYAAWTTAWSRDGSTLWFSTNPGTFYATSTSAGTPSRLVYEHGIPGMIHDLSPSEQWLLFSERIRDDVHRQALLNLDTQETRLLTPDGTSEAFGRFSPDGRWIAYVSDEEGEAQVFVRELAGSDVGSTRKRRVSDAGGWYPTWSPGGDEIFFLNREGQRILSASFRYDPDLQVGQEHVVFDDADIEFPVPAWILRPTPYDVGPDGRFLILARERQADLRLNVTLNWFEELERLVPVD